MKSAKSGKIFARLLLLCLFLFLAAFAIAGLRLYFSDKPELLGDLGYGKIVLDSSGSLIKFGLSPDDKFRLPIKLEDVPEQAIDALLRYEDQYFYSHPGVNVFALARSIAGLFGSSRRSGASTLTMQVARLKYKLKSSHITGKLRQIWLALLLERHYSKAEILEAYFNLAPYGGNIEGIEAAARIYFNKASTSLSPLEIQALTVVPQNPVKRNPLDGPQFDEARNRLQFLLDEESESESLPPLAVRSPARLPNYAQHLAMEMLRQNEGAIVETWLEKDLQLMLEDSLKRYAEMGSRFNLDNAAALIVDTSNMHVVALAGSSNFFDSAISGQIDGTRARRSPGSTLKPFIYALALDQGLIHPATILPDSPRSFGGYDPENFDGTFRGPLSAAEALRASRNLPALVLAEKLKGPDLYQFLKEGGIRLAYNREHYGLALALGGAELTMRELAALYAMLLNQGIWQPIQFSRKQEKISPRRLLSPEAAWLALWMLERPDSFIRSGGQLLPCRYKTGTSNGYRDAWTAGCLGRYVIIVWAGNFNNAPNPLLVGASAALPLFKQIAQGLGALRLIRDGQAGLFSQLNLARADICAATGDFARGQCAETDETIFIPGIAPVRDTGILRPVLIDKASGLRACREIPGKTEKTYWEFWPSDLEKVFAKAGIKKPQPPDWLPECSRHSESAHLPPPGILSPAKNMTYYRRIEDKKFNIALEAKADSDAGYIHWYAGREYIGKSRPGEVIFWQPSQPGITEILAVDSGGRSCAVKCRLALLPSS